VARALLVIETALVPGKLQDSILTVSIHDVRKVVT
jgi:hypothetical protein